ncbi:LCP family protein [Knoellia subterranea]|uniref:LytR family transcriptional regulator n=1 Tax=Knoellia subterranea KCTC 19937 TaxID=1385521 RepID=A0A0A0JIJ4_9MICO|nr:LCP family protein [Knoellia subterranea]KGN37230.1 LytR family transcriptional regulator [Knoellia subterranea KCTC 19937]
MHDAPDDTDVDLVAPQRGELRVRSRGERADAVHARRRARRRRGLVVMSAVASVLVVAMVAAYIRLNGNISRLDVSGMLGKDRPTPAGNVASGPLNILLVGSDVRQGDGNESYGDGDWEPGQHSDTNILMHISGDRKSVTMVSIPRDSMVPAPVDCDAEAPVADWEVTQWNQNFNTGGPGCLIRTIEGNTDVFVNHFAVVDFGGFKNMVDALGGVPVCTPTDINDSHAKFTLSAGRHTLDGEQALGYVRTRKSIGDGSDIGRIKRQQAFMASVAQEATKSSLLLRPDKLLRFLDAATQSLTTDPDFGVAAMKDVAESVKGIGVDKIQFVTVPTEAYTGDENRVQWAPAAQDLWEAIRTDRDLSTPKPKPSPTDTEPLTVTPDEIDVEVVNDAGVTGLAKQAVEALQVQGFPSPTSSNGTEVASGVTIEHSPEKADSARTVAAAFPGATLKEVEGMGSQVRVILGSGAPNVVEVPNRIGDEPIPTPTLTATPTISGTIETRKADADICS